MLEKTFQHLQALQTQVNQLPPAQQGIFTKTLDNLFNSLQELAVSDQFESATNNAAKLVELEKSNRLLERTSAQQASQLRQLQEQSQKELSQYRRENQALTKSEAKLQKVLRNYPDIISILESDGRVRYHSAALARVLGYKPETRIGKVQGELIHPDDLLAWQAYFGKLLEHPGIAKPIEYRVRHADGYWVYIESIGNSLLFDSNVRGIVMSSREIGERKQAELAIKESEFHYKIMSQITSDFAYSFRVTPDGKFVCEWATEAFARCTGYLPEELAASGWWNLDLVHPDDKQMLIEQLQEFADLRMGTNEYRIVNKKGEVRWVKDRWQAVWDKTEGRIVRLRGACQEISDRKQVELQLQLANEVLQAQIQSSPLAINCTDSEGKVTIWNHASEKLFGWSGIEVLGQDPPHIPEGQKQDFEDILKSLFNGKAQSGFEVSLLKKSGGWIDLWLFAAPVQDSSGQTIGTIKIFSDLSERKRIEEERKKLAGVQNMEEPFWVRYVTPPTINKKTTKK
ncbi:MAG: PAS domain S-box protein [Oscillatoriales cyanobacterium]|nr:MAG: PAS domain S-box protein [Oscillatoriales cyanobacterium]TAH15540.1 MAG: PAS domain S-box protein [Oscillatoriales cyanobacterium]